MANYLIKKWYLESENGKPLNDWDIKPNPLWFENLSKVNIFVGPNNSGKSRFLRYLLTLENECISPTYIDLDKLLDLIIETRHILKNRFSNIPPHDSVYSRLFPEFFDDARLVKLYIRVNINNPINIDHFIQSLRIIFESTDRTQTYKRAGMRNREHEIDSVILLLAPVMLSAIQKFEEFKSRFRSALKFKKIYIPVLRGLRPPNGGTSNNPFIDRTRLDYFKSIPLNRFDVFTGLEMYGKVERLKRGNPQDRKTIKDYEMFLANNFFEGQYIELTANPDSDVLHFKIGNEKEFAISQLGDGIQQLIIMTFPLFINRSENILAFIEEPELYLHPGLQRKLIDLLSSNNFGNLQTFLTTHSNHLLDLTLDFNNISINKFNKIIPKTESNEFTASFEISNSNNENLRLLEELGVKNSSVFLTNCTIWVEGITDRIYLRKYLEIYQDSIEAGLRRYEEDRHYSFVEYSGNNITHFSFLDHEDAIDVDRLCSPLFLVTDKDSGKDERHKKLKAKLGENKYYCLECREIENLLVPKVLLAVIKEYEGIESLPNEKFEQEDYGDKSLGRYIESKILKRKLEGDNSPSQIESENKKRQHSYAAESGTLKDKVGFAKKAIQHINSMDDMSNEAKKLTQKIHDFIKILNE